MTRPPRVSVLIGAYNNRSTLARAAASILGQTVGGDELELLIIDDGSGDDTTAVAAAIAEHDTRVKLLSMGRNVGISRSLNAGLAAARGPIVAVQDADDYSDPRRLERQLGVLDEHPHVAVVGCRMDEVDAAGRRLAPRTTFAAGDVRGVLLRFNPIPNTCAAFRREVALALGGYDTRYRYAMEYDLWLRIADAHIVTALDEPLSTRVMSATNVASRADRAQT
ncbi:MAG: glycosyltransferase family 2 protein, partial [Gaiellales bacterium]